MTETGLVWLVSSSGISTDRDIDQDIGSLIRISIDQESLGSSLIGRLIEILINRESSGISTYWEINWEIRDQTGA